MRTFMALVALLFGALQPAQAFDIEYDPPVEIVQFCLYTHQSDEDFLWELYWETPKIDRTENFLWKDPVAASLAGMDMQTYVVGGVHPVYRGRLARMLRVAKILGYNPGITSLFRDDPRQAMIKKGKRSAVGYSFHGNSKRGGHGNGMAGDVVSLNGNTRAEQYRHNLALWQWIDENGPMLFGLVRPYGKHDPPHVAPSDGEEYLGTYARLLAGKTAMLATQAKKKQVTQVVKAVKTAKPTTVAKVKKQKSVKKTKIALAQ